MMRKTIFSRLCLRQPADAIRALELFTGVMGGCEVMTARMAERAAADFLTVTELADTLVRREGVSFREAHGLVSASVKELRRTAIPLRLWPKQLRPSLHPISAGV